MRKGKGLILGCFVLVGATAYMAYLGASTSWQYYVTVDECIVQSHALLGKPLRVSGKVAADSLRIGPGRGGAEFDLTGDRGKLRVICSGPVPDNLAEEVDVVVEGVLENGGLLRAEKVLTRCASKYEADRGPAGRPNASHNPDEGP